MISRHSLAAAALLAAATSLACSRSHPTFARCPAAVVQLTNDWKREPAQYANVSLLVPIRSGVRVIPRDAGSIGEAWNGGVWNLYYKRDSAHTTHVIETGPTVHDLQTCVDTIDGHAVTITTLRSTGNSAPGSFGQATWMFPGKGSLYLSVLAPGGTSRDSMLSVLRGVKFTGQP